MQEANDRQRNTEKLKDCSFIVLQGKLLSALLDTGPKQMSFFFFFKTTSTLQGQFKRISDSSEMPKEYAAASLQPFSLENNQELSFACFYK